MSASEPRTYMGVNIWPADRNASGIRWTATVNGARLRAGSLIGITDIIRAELASQSRY